MIADECIGFESEEDMDSESEEFQMGILHRNPTTTQEPMDVLVENHENDEGDYEQVEFLDEEFLAC